MESKGILFLLNMVNVWAGEDEEFPKVLRFTLCYVLATDLCVSFVFFLLPSHSEKNDRRR